MPHPRFERLPPHRQEAILAAAAHEFAERGYAAASVNRMIGRAGTSKGALYYYFENKADLFATVIERAMARVFAEVDWPALEAFTAENYWARVREVSRRSLEQMEIDTWYMRILRSYYRLRDEPGARAATARVLDRSRAMVRAFFERGRDLGVVRTDLPLELLVEMHMASDEAGDRWMVSHWDALGEEEKHALLEARVDLMQDMWATRRGGADA
jgi:AcrR family transcriptional regulator